MKLNKIKIHNSLSEKVYEEIYRQISLGKLQPGQKITESQISQAMGISRAPVREAFKQLADDKLITLVPRSGCYVSKISSSEISEIYEIRKLLECMALEHAFDKLNLKQIAELKNKFQECLDDEEDVLIKKTIVLDNQFHCIISKASECQNLSEILEKFRARIQLLRIRKSNVKGHAKNAIAEHLGIINSILDRKKQDAINLLTQHIENTKIDLLRILESE